MSIESDNLATVRRYFAAIERGASSDEMDTFFAPDVVQIEFPNRFTVNVAQRDLAQLREAAERGRKVVESQRFEVRNALASGHQVALEVEWTATVKVPVGSIPAGGQMRAHFGVFIDFRDGKIVGQRNYDCFDPF
jgi:ketosteroid isomerase-like protein